MRLARLYFDPAIEHPEMDPYLWTFDRWDLDRLAEHLPGLRGLSWLSPPRIPLGQGARYEP